MIFLQELIDNIDILNLFPYSGPVPHIYLGDIYWGTPPFQEAVNEGVVT